MNRKRRAIIDGSDDNQGRSLLVISALYHCCSELNDSDICFLNVSSAAVRGAIDLLHWETGLNVGIASYHGEDGDSSIFKDANLYAAIRFDSLDGLHVAEAKRFEIPLLLALQFLPKLATSEQLALLRAAHDPALFAQHLIERMQ